MQKTDGYKLFVHMDRQRKREIKEEPASQRATAKAQSKKNKKHKKGGEGGRRDHTRAAVAA